METEGEVLINSIGEDLSFEGQIAQATIKECGKGIVQEAAKAAKKEFKKEE